MAFAAAVVAGMAVMAGAVVDHREMRRSERARSRCSISAAIGPMEDSFIRAYIEGFGAERERAWRARATSRRFHGRAEARALCAHPGCALARRVPRARRPRPDFDGPGEWQWLCLDHVREFNSGYNYFKGMSATRSAPPKIPMAAGTARPAPSRLTARRPARAGPISSIRSTRSAPASGARREGASAGRPRAQRGRPQVSADARPGASTPIAATLRRRYADLLRRFHPDHNGGDRGHEKALQAVIEAYTALKSRPAFA